MASLTSENNTYCFRIWSNDIFRYQYWKELVQYSAYFAVNFWKSVFHRQSNIEKFWNAKRNEVLFAETMTFLSGTETRQHTRFPVLSFWG